MPNNNNKSKVPYFFLSFNIVPLLNSNLNLQGQKTQGCGVPPPLNTPSVFSTTVESQLKSKSRIF